MDTIAFGKGELFQEAEDYTEFNVPIDYLSDSTPTFLSIVFSNGRKNGCTLSTCTSGTTLWIDDVSVSGGTVGVGQFLSFTDNFSIYPNPTSHSFRIQPSNQIPISRVSVWDGLGQELKGWTIPRDEYRTECKLPQNRDSSKIN